MARNARITSISFPGLHGDMSPAERAERSVEDISKRIEIAAYDEPDLIVLPETFTGLGCGSDDWAATAEPLTGPTSTAMRDLASRYGTHIVYGILRVHEGRRYNAAVLVGRDGKIIGVYHKMHPTISEIDHGVIPGTESVAWDTDIGRIGCAVCFDLNFHDVADSLAAHQADIVCFPSMYRGGLATRIWAFHYGFWFVSATPTENSVIVNPLGDTLVQSFVYSPTITANVNTDAVICHIDYNHARLDAVKAKYGSLVEVHTVAPEGVFLLTSHHPDLTVMDIVAEFELETRVDYWKRAHRARVDVLAGRHADDSSIPLPE
jgi:predicted amidohydrolase